MSDVQSISLQGTRKRCLCASSGVRREKTIFPLRYMFNQFPGKEAESVRCEEKIFPLRFMSNQFPGMEPERDAYVRPVGESSEARCLLNCFQGCSRWLTKCINVLSGHVRNPGGHVIKNLSL